MIPPKSPEVPGINFGPGTHQTAIDIKINEKSEYGTGNEKVTVLEFSGNPRGGFTRYSHHLKNNKKMKTANLKKGTQPLQNAAAGAITADNVHYVHVYYGGTDDDKPLLIAIKGTTWTYYKNNNPAQAANTDWSSVSINGDPEGAGKSELLYHLDKLNDDANNETVIHLEKTDTFGVDTTTKQYTTGTIAAQKTITVEKEGADDNVPTGYVAYSHSNTTGQLTDVKFRYSGQDITLRGNEKPSITIAANNKVWIFYHKDDTNTPLLLYYQQSSTNYWYGKGKKWEHHSALNVDASTGLPTDAAEKDKIPSKLNAMTEKDTLRG